MVFAKVKRNAGMVKMIFRATQGFRLLSGALLFLSLISGILEGVGITAIIPMFSFIDGSSRGTDSISLFIQAAVNALHLPFTLKTFVILVAILFIIKAAVLCLATYLIAYITANFEERTRNKLMQSTLAADWRYLSNQKLGYLDQILTTDINYSSALLTLSLSAITVAVNLLIYIFLVFNISPVIALCMFVVGLLVLFIFKPLFRQGRNASYKVSLMGKTLAHFVNENILGMKTIKSMAVEKKIVARTNTFFADIKRLNIRVSWLKNVTNVALQPIGLIFVLAIFSYFYKLNAFTFASFAVIVYAINKVFSYIQQLQNQFHTINSQFPSISAILHYAEELKSHQEGRIGKKPFTFAKELSFEQVSFSYLSNRPALIDVSFSIHKGEMVGIVGPSGAGKTTLVDLLLQLFLPATGRILIDGSDIATINITEWRKAVSYVSQDMFLMNDTVENNIRFYDDSITHEEVIAAAKMAQIFDLISELEKGFDTIVGERGLRLSGGQRQRVILARALARKPKILILDEATSALDNESEVLIKQAIERLHGQITIIAIAHRLSTVVASDRIVVIDNGQVVEQGKPNELLENPKSYFAKVSHLGFIDTSH